jgi:hypothetical protein
MGSIQLYNEVIMGGIFKKPKAPPPPPPPPPLPSQEDLEAKERAEKQALEAELIEKKKRRQGRGSTIRTSPQGVFESEEGLVKTLLGK